MYFGGGTSICTIAFMVAAGSLDLLRLRPTFRPDFECKPALELQGDPLPPLQGGIGVHRAQGVVADGQRLGEAQHRPVPADDGHVIRKEGAGIVVNRAQNGGGLASVGAGCHQHCLSIEGDTGSMAQNITLLTKLQRRMGSTTFVYRT